MDLYEATRVVFSRIQSLDHENASKIMGYLLIQDHGEKEMIRLAFGPDTLIRSMILKAKNELGIFSSSRFNNFVSPLTIPNDLGNDFHLSFLDDPPKSPNLYFHPQDLASSPNGNGVEGWGGSVRRSCSASDVSFGSDDVSGGLGWKPCLYYARGYCKNGSGCRFVHGVSDGVDFGSPENHFLGSSPNSFSAHNKCMNFLLQQHNEIPSPRSRLDRCDFSMNPVSRQIYLTFPADSTFSEEDVSNYFSIFGPVQDVRIPYQQKRMFGFVTFHYADTVKLILAKGNPHFVCDARVLVKPYKEKGKVPDKFRKQQMERGEFNACGSPTGLDPYDLQFGPRMFYNSQDMLRMKMEDEAELQQAIELQSRRLMGLQLLDVKRQQNHQRAFSTGAAFSPPFQSPSFFNRNVLSSNRSSPEIIQENGSIFAMETPAIDQQLQQSANALEHEKESSIFNEEDVKGNANGNGSEEESPHLEESNLQESLEHILPDNLFASPKAAAGGNNTAFSNEVAEKNGVVAPLSLAAPFVPATSNFDMASLKPCYFQAPRFTTGHGAMECRPLASLAYEEDRYI